MDFAYSAEQQMMRDSVQSLMSRIATPEYLRHLDRERLYPYELYDAWVEAGFIALPFSPDYGGIGASIVDLAIVAEEIGKFSGDVAMAFGGSIFCGLNVARKGSEEQKQYWLPRLLSGEIRMSISMSEPDAGSDVGAIRTHARRDGDAYVLNGQKIWATGGRRARQRHQRLCEDRSRRALPAGHVAVPRRQRHPRSRDPQARHARPAFRRHL